MQTILNDKIIELATLKSALMNVKKSEAILNNKISILENFIATSGCAFLEVSEYTKEVERYRLLVEKYAHAIDCLNTPD